MLISGYKGKFEYFEFYLLVQQKEEKKEICNGMRNIFYAVK